MADRSHTIIRLLEALCRVTGLPACLHDAYGLSGLPRRWREHWNAPCMRIKRRHQPTCARFCGEAVHRALEGIPGGRVHRCPFGLRDIAVPIRAGNRMLGVLFSGTFRTGARASANPGLPLLPSRRAQEDRRLLLLTAAHRIADLLQPTDRSAETPNRRTAILAHIQQNLAQPLRLPDLAARIGLSPSRAGHVIRSMFGMTFPALVNSIRLAEAARLLCITDRTAAEIAASLAFADQSHFTHAFRRRYRTTPCAYRRLYRVEA